jgi:hypothetical protein
MSAQSGEGAASGPIVSPERLLGKALILRAKYAAAVSKAKQLPAEALQTGPPPPPAPGQPPSRAYLLWQLEQLQQTIMAARARAAKIEATKQQVEVLETAAVLKERVDDTLQRFNRALNAIARQQFLKQLEELKKEMALTVAKLRLVPDLIPC